MLTLKVLSHFVRPIRAKIPDGVITATEELEAAVGVATDSGHRRAS